jgi:hypothetical protein
MMVKKKIKTTSVRSKRDKLPPVVKVRAGYRWDSMRGRWVRDLSFPMQVGMALLHKEGEAVSYGGAPEKVKAELLAARRAINTALRTLKTMGY